MNSLSRVAVVCLCLVLTCLAPFLAVGRTTIAQSFSSLNLSGQLISLRAGHTMQRSHIGLPHQANTHIQSTIFTVFYTGFPSQAQIAFQAAVAIWQTRISSPVTIVIQANWTPLADDILGSAAPKQYYLHNDTIYPVALANKLAGTDLAPNEVDIIANVNSSFAHWYYGTDGNTPQDLYDLETVVLHELSHGLGIMGSMTVNSATHQGSWDASGYPFIFDRFAANGLGQSLITTDLFPNPSTALTDQLTSDSVFFNGPQAIAAAGGMIPKLFAPTRWEQGASYSHLDEATYPPGDANALMTPLLNNGESIHDPGPIALGVLSDMGWTLAPVQATATPTIPPSALPTPTASGTFAATATGALPTPTASSFKVYIGVVMRARLSVRVR